MIKTTKLINEHIEYLDEPKVLTVLGIHIIQIQIEYDGQEAYIDLSKKQSRELASTLIEHCDAVDPTEI